MHLFCRHDASSQPPSPPLHPRERHPSIPPVIGSVFSLKTPHFVSPSESFSAAWMSGIERWKICYEFPRDKRAYQDPQGTNVCPGGDNIVAELGSEMAKNGNIVSDSDSSSRTYRSHQLDRLPS
mmetsp:Transcript_12813/g.23217  ORF Transcript_12813/g.23217 Transcript_12813/m.23217 type:complete len:124 (-) Transcript_12813:627-998(-)